MKLLSTASAIGFTVSCAFLFAATSVNAEPIRKNYHRHGVVHTHRVINRVAVVRPTTIRTVTTVAAFSLSSLPAGYVRFLHDGETFYFSDGVYYRKQPHGFVTVKPRAGFRVATLPRGYRVIRDGGATFYSYNNVRYRKVGGFFIVV
ncbi:MAG: hypothetical protein DHS20C12_20600 [Pseudohongiella sp.]|nr:MAG: hypothetical protein DHS20C12_20600 [Pseudohongiella sp.]